LRARADARGSPCRPSVGKPSPNLVADSAQRHAGNEALVDGDVRITYAELGEAADLYARGFVSAGVGSAQRVAIWAPNCAEWMLAALGALRGGASWCHEHPIQGR